MDIQCANVIFFSPPLADPPRETLSIQHDRRLGPELHGRQYSGSAQEQKCTGRLASPLLDPATYTSYLVEHLRTRMRSYRYRCAAARSPAESRFALRVTVQDWRPELIPPVFPSTKYFQCGGNKNQYPLVYCYVNAAGALAIGAVEELAMPLFYRLYNFTPWLTQNREEAEDLVQETRAKTLKGFSSL